MKRPSIFQRIFIKIRTLFDLLPFARTSGRGSKSLRYLSLRLITEKYINLIFSLDHKTAQIRSLTISVSFIIIWLVLSFTNFSAENYSQLVNNWGEAVTSGNLLSLIISSLKGFIILFFNLTVMRHLLALYAPFWLMQRIAAIYLADVLEKDQKVALTFIQQTAFAKPYHTIHIRQGRVAKEDQESPIIQIGGPGYVVVAMDSAVVVERPDGTARVIGPTAKRLRTVREHPSSDQHSSALIEGFERIRQGIDLRDIIQKQNVTSRSRDGIPVTAKNIQYSYSLYRGPKPSVESPQTPYPFDENAIFNLVYGAARPVKPGDPLARANIHDWLDPLPGKIFGQISSEMNSFINKRSLSDFLITTENDNNLEIYPQNSLETTPHGSSILTKIFYDNFQAKAAQRGIQLNWIKMGDWSTPDPIDLRRPTITHLQVSHPREVWEISRENLARGNPTELQRISNDARLNELIRLIQDISIKTSDLSTRTINIEKEKQIDDEQIILRALKEHLDVFKKARDFYRRDNIPIELLIVIREIERWL